MKSWIYIILMLLGFNFFSCVQVTEDIQLSKDGSGIYKLVYDGSNAFMHPELANTIKTSLKNRFDLQPFQAFDTVLTVHPNKNQAAVTVQVAWAEADSIFSLSAEVPFNKVSEIETAYQAIQSQFWNEMPPAIAPRLTYQSLYQWKKKRLTRLPNPEVSPQLSGEDQMLWDFFLKGATYQIQYHFPGKIRKSTIANANIIHQRTLQCEVPLTDYLTGQANLSGEIKYRNR